MKSILFLGAFFFGIFATVTSMPSVEEDDFDIRSIVMREKRSERTSRATCSCGVTKCGLAKREQRIVGGKVAKKDSYPWLAFMTYRRKVYCGGALIHKRYVLTASHCIRRPNIKYVLIHLGKHDKTKKDSGSQEIKPAKFYPHPDFNSFTFANDIGVVYLSEDAKLSDKIQPVCLPTSSTNIYAGENGYVAGWGRLSEGGKSTNILRDIKVPIMDTNSCRRDTKYLSWEIAETMMCAGYLKGKIDACQGDSGGPLMVRSNENGTRYKIVGIVSWGQGCGDRGYPGVYTLIGAYKEFIQSKMGDHCYCT